MKKIFFINSLLISIVISVNAQNDYYWYKNQKIFLEEIPNKKYLLVESIKSKSELLQYLQPNVKVTELKEAQLSSTIMPVQTNLKKQFIWATVEDSQTKELSFINNSHIIYQSSFYLTSDSIETGLSHIFYVKLKTPEDLDKLKRYANINNVDIVGKNYYMPLWYVLSCKNESKGNSLEMANYFYETGLFEASEPDLMVDDMISCVNDPHFDKQWGLENNGVMGGTEGVDLSFCQARQITMGNRDIVVAVLDHGIEMDHPDLPNIHPESFDSESGTSPSRVLGRHGTACAGIIGAASDNALGVAGIAPDSPLMSISNSLRGLPGSRMARADGINFAVENGASVISNSWGSGVRYTIIDDAIDNALANGRGGLGCVLVFTSGNYNTNVSYPANYDKDIIVVGGIDRCGVRSGRIDIIPESCDPWCTYCSPGSNFGTELDIVAPGSRVATTDRQGVAGYAVGDYHFNFGGTSSACPHVAAVAALILSVNPGLTQREVGDIIESTAQKVGTYTYFPTVGRPNGTWNIEVGHGMVDAFSAVQIACPDHYTIDIKVENDEIINYTASNYIIAENIIENGGAAEYHASNFIRLQTGFHAQRGSSFIANTHGCEGLALKSGYSLKDNSLSNHDSITLDTYNSSVKKLVDKHNEGYHIYPNPTSGNINIDIENYKGNPVSVWVYNLSGSIVYNAMLNQSQISINFSAKPPGIYLIKLIDNNKVITEQVIKK